MCECKFAEKLSGLRTAKGLTQAELANVFSVSDKVISKWENGLSTPDFETLILMAKYFGVSTDAMLGMEENIGEGFAAKLRKEFQKMDRNQAILAAFDISRAFAPAMYESLGRDSVGAAKTSETDGTVAGNDRSGNNVENWMPCMSAALSRNCISNEDFYHLTVCSEDVNLAVMLLRNRNDFRWLKDEGKKRQIAELFTYLSDTDALTICYYIHSKQCSWDFTVEYIASHTGVSVERTKEILDLAEDFGLCVKQRLHLISGEIDIYNSVGEGNVLTLITLAYEHMYRNTAKTYNYNWNSGCKMIRGNLTGGDSNESV